jgi:hypothetical protein
VFVIDVDRREPWHLHPQDPFAVQVTSCQDIGIHDEHGRTIARVQGGLVLSSYGGGRVEERREHPLLEHHQGGRVVLVRNFNDRDDAVRFSVPEELDRGIDVRGSPKWRSGL